jgi:hypothetical protein
MKSLKKRVFSVYVLRVYTSHEISFIPTLAADLQQYHTSMKVFCNSGHLITVTGKVKLTSITLHKLAAIYVVEHVCFTIILEVTETVK